MRMTIEEFINHVKENADRYIDYCEVLINPKGEIILSRPSHTEAVVREAMSIENCTRDELDKMIPENCYPLSFLCDKYNYCVVWYHSIMAPLHVSNEQAKTIKALYDNNIVSHSAGIDIMEEYWRHLWRTTIFGIFG